jgi:predicted 3-demethylubiquinone-9 3-methyltransferase (glyoxalase superfamily)
MGKKGSVFKKDKYGLSWQVVPTVLSKLMLDPIRAERVMKAFLKMTNLTLRKYCKHSRD